jgi:YHS domain-containing protein
MLSFAALSALALNIGLALADDNGHGHDRHRKALADKAQRTGHPYPLNVDPLDDSLADADRPVTIIHAGRELRFASEENTKTFKAAPGKYLAEVDPKIIAQQKPTYPLETCVVSGQKLGETGEPVACVYGNRLVRFCCGGCVNMFEKRPAKHLAAIDDHAESQ